MEKKRIIDSYAIVGNDSYIIYNHYEDGKIKKGKTLEFGKPFLETYNKYIDEIHAAGFRLNDGELDKEILTIRNGNEVKEFYLPSFENTMKEYEKDNLPFLDFHETGYIKLNGKITSVIHIYEESDLYFFDLNRLQEMNVKFKYCEDCDRLFIARKHQVRCEECQKSGMGEKKKYQNVMNDPVRHKRRNMIQKLRMWHKGNNLYQNQYKNDLISRFNEDGSNLEYLDQLHNRFKDLDKDILKSKNIELIDEWNDKKFCIWQQENPEQWLKEWYEKAGKEW